MNKSRINDYKNLKKYLKNSLTLKKAPSASFHQNLYKKIYTTKIDEEKPHYESRIIIR